MPGVAPRGRGRRMMNEINMVPFIDVMLVLLIIFMVTAPLITTAVVDLPSVGRARQAAPVVVEVIVGRDEQLQLRTRGEKSDPAVPVTLADLASRVRQRQGGDEAAPVVISADRNVKYDDVMRVMNALQEGGILRVGLAVKQAG